MWTLVALGAGQFVSIVGSRISAVALGLWVFQSTGSVTRFALVMALAMVPTLGLLPITGALADRLDRRRLVLAAELGLAVSMAVVAALALTGQLEVWHVYLNSVVHAVLVSFLLPSYPPLVAGLAPPERLTRANAIVSTGQLGGLSLAPLVAGLLVARIPLGTLLVLDVASYVGPILAVLLLRTPPATA
ncbi:MAG: MFS transporter, partial [Natronosporangium sp.]